nr:hypothetical protein [Streptomyces sp. DSM 41633]
ALEADKDGSTDASDRLAELDGVEFVDALGDDEGVEITEVDGSSGLSADDVSDNAPEGDDERGDGAAKG